MEIKSLRYGVIGGSQGMGSWFVNYLKDKNCEVTFSSNDESSQWSSNKELVENSDVIFLSVPITFMQAVIKEIFPYLNQKILIEVCSVKKFIIDEYNSLQKENPEINVEFHSFHPMFSQRVSSLEGQVFLYCFKSNDRGFFSAFNQWLIADQAEIFDLDYIRHDKVMGVVQGLNHFNIFVSARALEQAGHNLGKIKDVSSPPYRIFLIFFSRYVLQDPALYADIQMYNEFVPEVLAIFKQEVDNLYNIILKKDKAAFIEYVETTRYYFEENREDTGISNHLIEQLGIYLNRHK
ncbi:prephenate dehydrogenase/arogenate dehydrogenase family protein [Chondrinema litorale]|uniref:prephenate dehydrogenase/arogenate dehydrogenase family protein n=1 Tax=Chondrinema litorale TaxID=2994555 RepID=UPI00254327F0|nr:prephenate dehydrogenase/arogenate dehydrogenase family protein [Chondrinema litorale]UZR93879.1 prephenate dehydrogenase/arogenate dehydrogenase family protein [Chondrinema litorale]